MTGNKYLIPASHYLGGNEFQRVVDRVISLKLSRVGLELPLDYRIRGKNQLEIVFFGDLDNELPVYGVKTFPLEVPIFSDARLAFSIAYEIARGNKTREEAEGMIHRARSVLEGDLKYSLPESVYCARHDLKLFSLGLKVLDSLATCKDEDLVSITKSALDYVTKRGDEFILQNIQKLNLDGVVLGAAHVENIKSRLPDFEVLNS